MPVPNSLWFRACGALAFRLGYASEALRDRRVRIGTAAAGVPDAASIRTHMTRRELAALYQIAADAPGDAVALEVGSFLGASAAHIAAAFSPHARLLCVDTWQNETMEDGIRDTMAEFENNVRGVRDRIETRRQRSDTLEPGDIPAPLDIVFLDGDHSYAATNNDFKLIGPWIKPDGILAFHDAIEFVGVSRTIGEALESGEWKLLGHVDNLVWLKKSAPPLDGMS